METNKQSPRDSGKTHPKAHQTRNRSDTQNPQRRRRPRSRLKRKTRSGIATSAENPTGHSTTLAQHGRRNVTTVKSPVILQRSADQEP